MADWLGIEDPTDRLHGFVSGFHATYYVYTGVTCGLFEALTEPRTTSSLATECDLYEPYIRTFCETGLRWGLLAVDPATEDADDAAPRFHLREGFVELLASPSNPRYMGDFFRFLGAHQSEEYAAYPDCFETGRTRQTEKRERSFTASIEGSTRGLQDVFLDHLLPELSTFVARLERGGRLVDIGCGTGRLLSRLCAHFPAVEGVGVDLDADAIELARERADRENVANRTTFDVRDAADIDGPFDAAVLFMSVHEIPAEKRQVLFDRLGDALTPDGVVVVFDEVYPDRYHRFDQSPFAAGVETQWAELTWGADVPTDAEHSALLAAADCTERVNRTIADRFTIYEGTKT